MNIFKKLDAIIQLHLTLNLPETAYLYLTKEQLEKEFIDFSQYPADLTLTYPKSTSEIKCDTIQYGGFVFYYFELPE